MNWYFAYIIGSTKDKFYQSPQPLSPLWIQLSTGNLLGPGCSWVSYIPVHLAKTDRILTRCPSIVLSSEKTTIRKTAARPSGGREAWRELNEARYESQRRKDSLGRDRPSSQRFPRMSELCPTFWPCPWAPCSRRWLRVFSALKCGLDFPYVSLEYILI